MANSTKIARDAWKEQIEKIRDEARKGKDLTFGSDLFWKHCAEQLATTAQVTQKILDEVANEQEAAAKADTPRLCRECGAQLVKKHKRGRWPIYCDSCKP